MSKNQPFVTLCHKKNSISCRQKNHRLPVIAGFRFRCRDKIEPNLQSQNVRRTHPKLMESRFQRDQKLTANRRPVNTIPQISAIFCQEAIPLHSALYLFASRWLLNCKALNKKCCKFVATRKENYGRENFLLFCCPSDDDFAEKPRMIRIIRAEFISRPCLDPIGGSNTSLCDCEQGLFASPLWTPRLCRDFHHQCSTRSQFFRLNRQPERDLERREWTWLWSQRQHPT